LNSRSAKNIDYDAEDGAAPVVAPFRTLVVDGKHFFIGFLEAFLQGAGHMIMTADSYDDAVAKTRQFQPDLILLDTGLEGVDCLELLSTLLMEQSSAAVLLLARNPSVTEAIEAMKIGALDYLAQPLDPRKLKQVIETQKLLFKDAHG
jgi:DNA-binding response OmpR family regulator